jgi:hypothetical protein
VSLCGGKIRLSVYQFKRLTAEYYDWLWGLERRRRINARASLDKYHRELNGHIHFEAILDLVSEDQLPRGRPKVLAEKDK